MKGLHHGRFKTLLITALLLIAGGLLFVYSGLYNIAADEPHWNVTRWLLEKTQERSVEVRSGEVAVPSDLDSDERIRAGATSYASMCEICHLAPGVQPTPLHTGLRPSPPVFARQVSQHSPEYLFWAVKHGIKMTGMPAWGETHGDEELWDIVAFLQELPGLTEQQYSEMTQGANEKAH